MLKREQMEQIIRRGGSIAYRGNLYTSVDQLPSASEIEEHYNRENRTIDYSKIFARFGIGSGSKERQPQLPVIYAPPTDEELAKKYPFTDEFGLGRIPQTVDVRDQLYPMSAAIAPVAKEIKEIRMRYWTTASALDQGDTAQCVAYSRTQLLLSGPVKNKTYSPIYDFYKACQRVDEWPGEDYDGTSVRAMCKVMQSEGHITGYTWATDTETVAKHVLGVGPVVLGTNWYNSMFYPDAITGFIRVQSGSGIAGGHAYMLKGANRDKLCPDGSRGAFRIINSWGTEWGQQGMAFISFNDVTRLIREYGEAAGVNEIKFSVEAEG